MVWFQSKYNHSSQERSILYPPLVMIKAHKIHSSIWVHYRIKNPSEMIEERIPAKIWYIRTTDISILKWTCLIIELNSYPSTTESHTLFSISNVETELMNAHSHTECLCMINPPWMISPYVLNQFGPWKRISIILMHCKQRTHFPLFLLLSSLPKKRPKSSNLLTGSWNDQFQPFMIKPL